MYGNTTGLTSCYACETGTFAEYDQATRCESCTAGFFSNETGQSSCAPCVEETTALFESCAEAQSIGLSFTATVAVVAGGVGGFALLVIGLVTAVIVRRRQLALRVRRAKITTLPLTDMSSIPSREELLANMNKILAEGTNTWKSTEALATNAMHWYRSQTDDSNDTYQRVVTQLEALLAEHQLLLKGSVTAQQYDRVERYSEKVQLLIAALPPSSSTTELTNSSKYEVMIPGLLLHKDRFEPNSQHFLGRGASAAVSRATWVEFVGSKEIRHRVAVKEVPKTGLESENAAMRELLLLKLKLKERHSNIMWIFDVKSTGSMYYVIMQLCEFSLADQPDEFRQFLHENTERHAKLPGTLVLNELVRDLMLGMSTLHSKHIVHCDIKPSNVLVTFNRGGKEYAYAPEHFARARLVIADFGISRAFSTSSGNTTMHTASLDLQGSIAGTEAFMSPRMLKLLRRARSDNLFDDSEPAQKEMDDVDEAGYLANDSFACGCTIAYLCSNGTHPFADPVFKDIPSNIIAYRRLPLHKLNIKSGAHMMLVDRLTRKEDADRWSITRALSQSGIFGEMAQSPEMLMEEIEMYSRPTRPCVEQLLTPELMVLLPHMREMVCEGSTSIVAHTERILEKRRHQNSLDFDSVLAIVAYTHESDLGQKNNIYFQLNDALRARKTDPGAFAKWQGYFFYLQHALSILPPHNGVVYRGGNKGLDHKTVRKEYYLGRPIQWAAFSSTSIDESTAKAFVDKQLGVLFKITVASGRQIGAFSAIPSEQEVLLTPNTRFAVSREMYFDEDGFACVDLAESHGDLLSS